MRAALTASLVACAALQVGSAQGPQRGGTPQNEKLAPVNAGGNPYRVIRDWARLDKEGRPWGGSNGVAIDRDGRSVWATDRCSPGTTPGCLGSTANPVHHFDESGREIRSFGGGMFVWPHGIHVDRDGNVWVTDSRAASPEELTKYPGEGNKGSVVIKFSPDGKVLLTLGKPGRRGDPPDALTDPTDVVTDPANGDVYVAESHTNVADPALVARISVFNKDGRFLRTIGKTGQGPGEFRTPHALEFDSRGRLVVGDRHNHRVQVLTKEGKFVLEYPEFGRVSGLAIDAHDTIYTADSESTDAVHPGWRRGIRIGSLKDGKVTIFVPPHEVPNSTDGAMGEGIAIDAAGNVYTAEAQLRGVTKYIRSGGARGPPHGVGAYRGGVAPEIKGGPPPAAAPINAPFLPPTMPPTPAPDAAPPPTIIAVLPHERSSSRSISRRSSSRTMSRVERCGARSTVRRDAGAVRVERTVVAGAAAGTAAGRSAVKEFAGTTNCPSAVWTNAGLWLNAFSESAFAPTVYITTPETSAAANPAVIGFIVFSLPTRGCQGFIKRRARESADRK